MNIMNENTPFVSNNEGTELNQSLRRHQHLPRYEHQPNTNFQMGGKPLGYQNNTIVDHSQKSHYRQSNDRISRSRKSSDNHSSKGQNNKHPNRQITDDGTDKNVNIQSNSIANLTNKSSTPKGTTQINSQIITPTKSNSNASSPNRSIDDATSSATEVFQDEINTNIRKASSKINLFKTNLLSRKRKHQSSGLQSSPLQMSSSTVYSSPPEEKQVSKYKIFKDQYPTQFYQHNSNSDDDISLMPTLAIGFENSFKNRRKNRENDLRITDEGYYFQEVNYGDSDEETDKDIQIENGHIEGDIDVSSDYIILDNFKEGTSAIPQEFARQDNFNPSLNFNTPYINIYPSTDLPIGKTLDSKNFQFSPNTVETIEEDQENLINLLNNIPIISNVFKLIDSSTKLTNTQKAFFKFMIIMGILYEIQAILEIFYELFKFE
ncbi:hypothetical protein WICMUC_000861 [Wickerhamomyces mucosus]|uniref:Uncharacterized protein n=1 Tax=Wickerhamomyces mucosus TaxID=1378264 RepID=A0A9P8PYI7_9ASCO|nr:hypothetical protein WICMUC_000861 [Wickerhamomyces mucosus]